MEYDVYEGRKTSDAILAHLKALQESGDTEGAKTTDMADALSVDIAVLRPELVVLEELNLIYRTGQTRATRWFLGAKPEGLAEAHEVVEEVRESKTRVEKAEKLKDAAAKVFEVEMMDTTKRFVIAPSFAQAIEKVETYHVKSVTFLGTALAA